MLDSAPLSGGLNLSIATTAIVFLSVAVTVAGMGYWIFVRTGGPAAAGSTKGRSSRNGWVIFDEQSAQKAARQGMWGAFLVAILTGAVALLAGSGFQLVKGVALGF